MYGLIDFSVCNPRPLSIARKIIFWHSGLHRAQLWVAVGFLILKTIMLLLDTPGILAFDTAF